ncbi:MAG: hypothetical protein PHQ35_10825 [Phycisphaerae bacterium]|nr:hypothetical protein [Phycisphaerae bacterium]
MAQHLTYSNGIVYTPTLHNAVGVSTSPLTDTSRVQIVAGAKGVGFEITGAGITTRSAVFTVTVSMDGGTNFRAYSMLLSNAANTNSQTLTRVASVTQAATGTTICWMTPETLAGITHIQTALVITDTGTPAGTFTVKAVITY